MKVDIQLFRHSIEDAVPLPHEVTGAAGAWVEFRGLVRQEEEGQSIAALEYEAYEAMAVREMRRIVDTLATAHPVLAVVVHHRWGVIRVGETAIYVGVAARHRQPAFGMLAAFMDRLKQDVPIWKRRAISLAELEERENP